MLLFLTKEEELNAKSVEDPFQMIPPAGRDWAMICSSFQDIASKKSESSNCICLISIYSYLKIKIRFMEHQLKISSYCHFINIT